MTGFPGMESIICELTPACQHPNRPGNVITLEQAKSMVYDLANDVYCQNCLKCGCGAVAMLPNNKKRAMVSVASLYFKFAPKICSICDDAMRDHCVRLYFYQNK